MKLSDVMQIEEAKTLEKVLASKGESPKIKKIGDPHDALKFMRALLRGSYLFGVHVIPTYMCHIYKALIDQPPVDDEIGVPLRKITEMCIGELSTNNIFNREGESHSHFRDLLEAYGTAGGDVEEFNRFVKHGSIAGTPELWSPGATAFAQRLMKCCEDRLASFILMPCNESLTTIIYPVALKHLSAESRFDKFRRFMEMHVELDGNGHEDTALEWLSLYLRKTPWYNKSSKSSADYIMQEGVKKVLALYE